MIDESRGSRGFGSLCFSLIPAALGGAAFLWAIAVMGWLDITNELRQERRAMERVGIKVLPKDPIQLVIQEDTCLKVSSSFLDGSTVTIYMENKCHKTLINSRYEYRAKAHDNTVIISKWNYLYGAAIPSGEKREFSFDIDKDNRAEVLEVSIIDGVLR